MKCIPAALAALLLLVGPAFAAPAACWRFEDGPPGETASVLASEADGAATAGKACLHGKGTLPAFDADVPADSIWDGATGARVHARNGASLRFVQSGQASSRLPAGGEVVVSGGEQALHAREFTVEAFVKVERPTAHHMLIVSKRRRDFGGCSWSLSIDPAGVLRARFDTQAGQTGKNGVDWNQTFGAGVVADGQWHHVALTYEHATRRASLFIDHTRRSGRTTRAALVYDASDLTIGRGAAGLIDEVRLTPAALHPEQFLRPTRFFSDLKPAVSRREAVVDETPTRVQTGLRLAWPKLGTLKPGIRKGVSASMWSLGCETLDRDLADWDAYKGYLEALGIKRIRLQGGWARTEKQKGVYDFAWLDHVVDDALERGLSVCLETSYGNRLYQPGAGLGPGGLLPQGEETLAAWDRWVEAMVRRYAPKGVKAWMMYNEPNLRKENTAEKTAAFNIRTAEIIKRVDPEARIGGLVSCSLNLRYIEAFLRRLREQGKTGLFHWLIYHAYGANPDAVYPNVEKLRKIMAQYAPNMRLWQGEAGCASEEVQYALSGVDWTELSHAKWNARRMLGDLGHDVESAVFTISDLSYNKNFISRYGLLKTNPDNSIIKVKSAYYVVQNVVSVFNDSLERVPDYALQAECAKPLAWYAYRDKRTGLDLVTFWDRSAAPGDRFDTTPARLTVRDGRFREPVWVDTLTGRVYAIPADDVVVQGSVHTFTDIPV